MKKIIIECPVCHRINEATVGFFGKKKITCHCGHVINVKDASLVTKTCSECGNLVVYNKAKDENPVCPVCKNPLIKKDDNYKFLEIICPHCESHLLTNKNDVFTNCPICGENIDIEETKRKLDQLERNEPLFIKSSSAPSVIAWKENIENFTRNTVIIVDESQFGLLLNNGALVKVLDSGKYVFEKGTAFVGVQNEETANNVYSSIMYYVNKNVHSDIKWGTDSKIRLFDPGSGLHVELGGCGTFAFKVTNPEIFLFKTIGTSSVNDHDILIEEVVNKIKTLVISSFKSSFARVMRNEMISCLEIDERANDIADLVKDEINKEIIRYGITLDSFIISRILTPDDDPNYKRLKEQFALEHLSIRQQRIETNILKAEHDKNMQQTVNQMDVELLKAETEAKIKNIRAQADYNAQILQNEAEAHEMKSKGYTYNDQTRREVSLSAVQNGALEGGSGSGGDDGIGLTSIAKDQMKAELVKKVGKNVTNDILNSLVDNNDSEITYPENKPIENTWTCPNCGKSGLTSKFCFECGAPKPSEEWDCPECGNKGIKTKFCPNCGHKR